MSSSSTWTTGRVLLLLGRLALAAVFLYAAFAKLKPAVPGPFTLDSLRLSLSLFATQVDSYQLLPSSYVNFVAHTLPFFELFLGLWLLSGWQLRFSSGLTSALLLGFFGNTVRAYALGLEINCGCFGPGEALGAQTLIQEGSLLALSLAVTIGAFWSRRARRESSAAIPSPAPQKAE